MPPGHRAYELRGARQVTAGKNTWVHPKVMWAKFESLAAGARLATAELWGRAAA